MGAVCCFVALACPAFSADAVRIWEAPLAIPTYELGPPDPNPVFPDLTGRGRRPFYPYPALDNLAERRIDRSYSAVFLENEFLRVTVLPQLGGRLYSIYDKGARREALYTNHVVKYGLVAIRGAWISGGIEWNFPDGHTATTVSPVDYTLRREPDGGAAVIVGDTERVQRMQWAVAIRLRPGRKLVETEVTLNNRREVPGRYWYWATAAAPAADDLRFVYPMREAYPHTFWPVFSFPRQSGVDLGTFREVPHPLSLFARNSKRDFFGVYYEKADWGIVHVADHRDLPGKKTWTWGTDPSGSIWIDKLTDKDGQYVEFQAGRFETQMEHQFIAPHRVEGFVEYWIPLDKLGGPFDEANRDAALRCALDGRHANLSIQVTARFEDASLIVERGGEAAYQRKLTLMPDRPFNAAVNLEGKGTGSVVGVQLKSKEGREILSWRSDIPVDGNPDFRPARRPDPETAGGASAERAWREGVAADKKSDDTAARAAWREALKRDPGYSPALMSLGLSYYRSGEYDEALKFLQAALSRDRDSAGARYAAALVLRSLGQNEAAAEHLVSLVRSGGYETASLYLLGEMALAAGNPGLAVEHLGRAVTLDPRDLKARTMLALALRLAGKLDGARVMIEGVGNQMPIDYLALSEAREIGRALGKDDAAAKIGDELWRLLAREPDSVLELCFDYLAAGRTLEAKAVLEEAVARAGAAGRAIYPMIHYTLGFLLDKEGKREAALGQWDRGMRGLPSLVFPHRVEEIGILKTALAVNPADGRAAYYLGNLMASLGRVAEALDLWRAAVRNDALNPVAWRNLAQALWRKEGKLEEAGAAFAKAIALAPEDYHRYVEFAALLSAMKDTPRRVRLLETAPAGVKTHSAVVQALAAAYVDAERYSDALRLLESARITSGEGESGALAIYRRAALGVAAYYQRFGKHAEAAAEYVRATLYPPNLGVGRSSSDSHAREYVLAARAYEAAGQPESAKVMWQRAAAEPLKAPTEPSDPWSDNYYWKALALGRAGRPAESEALFKRLAALADDSRMLAEEATPPEGAIRFLLAGLGLRAVGKPAQARAMLIRCLELDPGNELARSELKSIGDGPRQLLEELRLVSFTGSPAGLSAKK